MKLISRTMVVPHETGKAPIIDFVTYIHPHKPVLLRRLGWETADDVHEQHYDLISQDNGNTWKRHEFPPAVNNEHHSRQDINLVCTESAAVYLPQRDRLVLIRNRHHQPVRQNNEGFQLGHASELVLSVSQADQRFTAEQFVSQFGLPKGLALSFAHPLVSKAGTVLVPVQTMSLNNNNNNCLSDLGYRVSDDKSLAIDHRRVGLLQGEFVDDDTINWTLGGFVPADPALSSRGMCEGTIAELSDDSLAMVMRGSNHLFHEKPGYKWVSFSKDMGSSWTEARPLGCDQGEPIESSSTGSLLFRSSKSNQLYWLGNLCIDGVRPSGNMPRSPLVIAKVNEYPFALVRDSILVLDRPAADEHPNTQHSNFQLYIDRESGDAVFHLTRYGERGYEAGAWLNADQYCYRVALD